MKENGKLKQFKIGIGIVGFLIGGFVGFLARPSAFLTGQLPFEHVISRGANLTLDFHRTK